MPAFARHCCSNQSISPACRAHSSKPTTYCCSGRMGQTDRRTLYRFTDRTLQIMWAVPTMHHTPARNRAKCLAIVEILSLSDSLVPVNTQDRPYPSEIIVLIQHTVTVHSSVTDIGCYFFQLILHVNVVLCNCSNSRIWLFIYIYITLAFFSVLSQFHFILALWQSCVLSTVVPINEYEC